MIQWTNKLEGPDIFIMLVWEKHFKSRGYRTEIRKFGKRYRALFVDTAIINVPASLMAYCENHRIDNLCSSDCEYYSLIDDGRIQCKARKIMDNMRGKK